MRYVEPVVGFVLFLCFFLGALVGVQRSWQRTAQLIMGLSGMAACGLILLRRISNHSGSLLALAALLGGIAVGIFITLFIEGTLNPVRGKGPTRAPGESREEGPVA
jgi:hypothetical protein